MKKTRIQKYYINVVLEDLLLEYDCRNMMQLPQIDRIVLSTGLKTMRANKHEIIKAFFFLELLSGQKSCATRAHKSIAAFQLRKGSHMGCFVTLRKSEMYVMLDKILTLLFPRLQKYSTLGELCPIKLRHGGNGIKQIRHLSLGLSEAPQFPEVESSFETLGSLHGFNISMCFRINIPELKYGKHLQNWEEEKTKNSAGVTIWDLLFLSAFQYPFAPIWKSFDKA